MKTKGALLMEYKARKTKGAAWLDFVFLLLKEEISKRDGNHCYKVRFRKSSKLVFWAEEAQGMVWQSSVHALYREGRTGKSSILVRMDYMPDAGNLNEIDICWASSRCQALYIHFLFKPYNNPRRKNETWRKYSYNEDQVSTLLTVLIANSPHKGSFWREIGSLPVQGACIFSETRRI